MSNLKYKKFKGCRECEMLERNCAMISVPVNITFKKDEKADDWGRTVTVFKKGETVKGYAIIKHGTVYCASAASNIYDGYEDFVNTENIDVELCEGEVEK